jgi:Family of unknown function (DUF6308)
VTTINLPTIQIDYADEKAAFFFVSNASSVGDRAFDNWAVSPQNPHNSFVPEDVTVINTSMAMRTPPKDWEEFTTGAHTSWVASLNPSWDIVAMSDKAWVSQGCQAAIENAINSLNGTGRRAAGVTKMLHLKRPKLIPICDSYVMTMMGQQAYTGPQTCALISAIRVAARTNLTELQEISDKLASIGIRRSLVRILDSVMWFDGPTQKVGPYSAFESWLTTHHGGRLFF